MSMGVAGPERGETLSMPQKLLRLNWLLILLLCVIGAVGGAMLYSVAGGEVERWTQAQMTRFGVGILIMIGVALVDIRLWMRLSYPLYGLALLLLVAVEIVGVTGMGAQRWIDLGVIRLQPSEVMKVALVMALAQYYHTLNPMKVSQLQWIVLPLLMIAAPAALVIKQPDLGTAILLLTGGLGMMFLAGVALWFFALVMALGGGAIYAVFASRGQDWQILKDYQYRRIEVFLDPEKDPLGAGYHIMQSKIAFGSGGVRGKGFLEGPQSRLNFLPEKHTDFIFTTLAEEFGLVGSLGLLGLYLVVLAVCALAVMRIRPRYGRLLAAGAALTFFLYFAVNMAMVTGLAPVVGVPLPLVSYGGTQTLSLLFAFGLLMSAQIHRQADTGRRGVR